MEKNKYNSTGFFLWYKTLCGSLGLPPKSMQNSFDLSPID